MLGLLALAITQTPAAPALDNAYMQMGSYYATSRAEDPQALGGFGISGAMHQPVEKHLYRDSLNALLSENKSGLILYLSNGSTDGAWIRAADSNILGILEAKDKHGNWRPIEYKPWYTCGNSYHRLHLPVHEGWKFLIDIPRGTFYTAVRWKYFGNEKPLYSNEVKTGVPETRFELQPSVAAHSRISTEWGSPTLVPKG